MVIEGICIILFITIIYVYYILYNLIIVSYNYKSLVEMKWKIPYHNMYPYNNKNSMRMKSMFIYLVIKSNYFSFMNYCEWKV